MRSLVLLALLLCPAQFTHNRFTESGKTFSQDGTDLMTDCMSKIEGAPFGAGLCAGYIEGIADSLSEGTICIPPEVSGRELTELVLRYAEKHEDDLHHSASRVVSEALKSKYLCAR